MAFKKKSELTEGVAPKAEEIGADKVAVEMTQEQKNKFADFLVKEEQKVEAAKSEEGFVQAHLFAQHHIGRQKYGPGPTKIPEGIAGLILYQDSKRTKHEVSLNTSNRKLWEVLHNGQAIRKV